MQTELFSVAWEKKNPSGG